MSDEGRVQVTTNRLVGAGRTEEPQTYWGHDLDLSRSRDVVEDVTIRFAICTF